MSRSTNPRLALRTPALILGAVIAALMLAACSSAPQQSINLTDEWFGEWTSVTELTGLLNVTFTQTGNQLNGDVDVDGTFCFDTGTITGTVSGNDITFGLADGLSDVEYTGAFKKDTATGDDTIEGNYAVTTGTCAGDTGVFVLYRTIN